MILEFEVKIKGVVYYVISFVVWVVWVGGLAVR